MTTVITAIPATDSLSDSNSTGKDETAVDVSPMPALGVPKAESSSLFSWFSSNKEHDPNSIATQVRTSYHRIDSLLLLVREAYWSTAVA